MGSTSFNKIQYGKEDPSSKGTAVACTDMWIGRMPRINSDGKPTFPVEHFGKRAEFYRAVKHGRLYQNTLSTEHGAFQHLPFLFGAGIKGAVTAAEQTSSQSDYLWNFTPSVDSINDIDSFTLRFGDNVQAWMTKYAVVERIRISGQIAQGSEPSPVSIEADFFGRKIETTTFTSNINAPTLVGMNAKLARLYVDTSWAGVGGTEAANLLRSFDIEIITGQKPKFSGSADETFSGHSGGVIGVVGTFGIEGGSSANGYFANHQNGDLVVVQLDINGPAIGSGDNYQARFRFGGAFEDASPIDGEDRGDNLSTMVVRGYHDPTGDKTLELSVLTNGNTY